MNHNICFICGCPTGGAHGQVVIDELSHCRHCAKDAETPKAASKRTFKPGEHDMPWDDWDAFVVKVILWVKRSWKRFEVLDLVLWGIWGVVTALIIAFIAFMVTVATVKSSGHCETRHERWLLEIDQHRRDHAYDGMKQCRKSGDAMREAYFSEYLEDTMGDKR